MAANAALQPNTARIVRDARILGGEPTVAGTRTSVRSIVLAARESGSAAGVIASYPHLLPDDVADALAYYERHRSEVDEYILRNRDDTADG